MDYRRQVVWKLPLIAVVLAATAWAVLGSAWRLTVPSVLLALVLYAVSYDERRREERIDRRSLIGRAARDSGILLAVVGVIAGFVIGLNSL